MLKLIYKWTDKIKEKVAALSERLGEKGQGVVEYAMIIAAVAIIASAVLYGTGEGKTTLQLSITNAFQTASEKISAVKP